MDGPGGVRLWVRAPVATLTFDRGSALNALSGTMIQDFLDHVRNLEGSHDVRALIVCGAAPAFCAGADQREVAKHLDAEYGRWLATSVGQAMDALDRSGMFTIAVVTGPAYGGGAEIALRCDYRIAEPDARFAYVQARNGLSTAWGGGRRLVELLGERRALALLLSGRALSADEALRLGVVDELAAPGCAMAVAQGLAATVSRLDPGVVRAIRRCVQAWAVLPADEARELEVEVFTELWGADAHRRHLRRWRESDGPGCEDHEGAGDEPGIELTDAQEQ